MKDDGKQIDKETALELMKAFGRFHRKEMEITDPDSVRKHSDMRLLFKLSESQKNGGLKVSELSRIMRVTSPFITQSLNRLEKEKLVKRQVDQKDRRIVRVVLTEEGIKAAERAFASLHERFVVLADHLGKEQSQQLAVLLNKAFDYMHKH
ncbi:DNA-binding transcriptional regulator, MarR family [Evansella caseinilytica]|uniref:DNA-binding transcriptional regulator, MarR family n=1 Tax=Evansella caseinilytica TaxID=1503961 RepID=A0A1H3TF72_9BACI|nr:MarR family transcriptional regulator [Evansella caseinilytica]SDZ48481.1 DNA-binding transcriptional regulator, MarR family [Evansella caseinilytica]